MPGMRKQTAARALRTPVEFEQAAGLVPRLGESQKSDIRTHIDSIQELQMALIAYWEGFSLKNDLQKFSKRKDFSNSQALTLLERLDARQLSYDHYCYGCEHYHSLAMQSSSISELSEALRERVESAIPSSSPIVPISATSSSVSTTQHRSKIKIELPTFSGEPLKWTNFWKLFSRLIERR